jgi:hypothetical protein
MIKGALCLYGQPRFYFNNDTLLRNIIETNKNNGIYIDIFFHTWWENESSVYPIAPWAHGSHTRDMTQLDMSKYDMDFLLWMYKPIDYRIEPPRDFSNSVNIPQHSDVHEYIRNGNVMSQYYSTHVSAELMIQSGVDYSFVIRARFDTFIEYPLDIRKYLIRNKFPEGVMIIPDNCHNQGLYNDNFSISSPYTFMYITRLYERVQEYLDNGVPYLAEELFKHHIDSNNIAVVKDVTINQMFFRGINYVHP